MTLNKSRGFTLVELIVVMALMAIMASLILFGIHSMTTDGRMRSSSFDVITLLRSARSMAMSSGNVHAVRYDLTSDVSGDYFSHLEVVRFDYIGDPMKYRKEKDLWEAVDSFTIPRNRIKVAQEQYSRKNIRVDHESRTRPGADERPPMLFFPDGSCNDIWMLTVRDFDNDWNTATGNYERPREVFEARIGKCTGLPDTLQKLSD